MTPDHMQADEALKAAVRRVWGLETAPPRLRAAVERLTRARRQRELAAAAIALVGGVGIDLSAPATRLPDEPAPDIALLPPLTSELGQQLV